jgi:hypothetical protein
MRCILCLQVSVDGQLQLIEQWQREKIEQFKLSGEFRAYQHWDKEHGYQHKLFNTNNLWISINKVASLMGLDSVNSMQTSSSNRKYATSNTEMSMQNDGHLSDVIPKQAVVEVNMIIQIK